MNLREQLLDLLAVGPAGGYALHQDVVLPLPVVERELARLVTAGDIRRIDNLYHRVERPAVAEEPPAPHCTTVHHAAPPAPPRPSVPIEEPAMTIKCKRCGENKLEADMCIRGGKPSKLCKTCFAKSVANNGGHRGKTVKPAAKAPKTVKSRTIKEVVRKHVAPAVAADSLITTTLAELQLRRAVIDQVIELLSRLPA